MQINESLLNLTEAIKSSSEFIKLKQAKTGIAKNASIQKDFDEFTASQKQLLSGRLSAKEADSRIQQLNVKFQSLSKIPEVADYLKASNAFNAMMSKIYGSIGEQLERNL